MSPGGHAAAGGVRAGWRLVRVGRDAVQTLDELVEAVGRRKGRGDTEAIFHFEPGQAIKGLFSESSSSGNWGGLVGGTGQVVSI